MSLIKCPECGGNVSEHANACPHCGVPMGIIRSMLAEETIEREPCPHCGAFIPKGSYVCPNCCKPTTLPKRDTIYYPGFNKCLPSSSSSKWVPIHNFAKAEELYHKAFDALGDSSELFIDYLKQSSELGFPDANRILGGWYYLNHDLLEAEEYLRLSFSGGEYSIAHILFHCLTERWDKLSSYHSNEGETELDRMVWKEESEKAFEEWSSILRTGYEHGYIPCAFLYAIRVLDGDIGKQEEVQSILQAIANIEYCDYRYWAARELCLRIHPSIGNNEKAFEYAELAVHGEVTEDVMMGNYDGIDEQRIKALRDKVIRVRDILFPKS